MGNHNKYTDEHKRESIKKFFELKNNGMTGKEAAKQIGVADTVIYGWNRREKGVSTPMKRRPKLVTIPIQEPTTIQHSKKMICLIGDPSQIACFIREGL